MTTPDGVADAYHKLVEAGWGAISFNPEFGGGGFPNVVGLAVQEMMTSANMGFSLCPLLTQGPFTCSKNTPAKSNASPGSPRWSPASGPAP